MLFVATKEEILIKERYIMENLILPGVLLLVVLWIGILVGFVRFSNADKAELLGGDKPVGDAALLGGGKIFRLSPVLICVIFFSILVGIMAVVIA